MNKMILMAVSLCLAIAGTVSFAASPKKTEPVKPSKTILLYPKGQDVDEGIIENGVRLTSGPLADNGLRGEETSPGYGDTYNVGNGACLDLYFPKKPNGQMVVVCPGGGYFMVSMWNEGSCVADWLVEKGITVCVVKYRLPQGNWDIPLHDVQNAFRYCRAHAKEWGIRSMGIMGFSAGGHLAATASVYFTDKETRPDFSILLYPVISIEEGLTHQGTHDNLIGRKESYMDKGLTVLEFEENVKKYDELVKRYSLQYQVKEDTPKTFLALSENDNTVPPENSILYYEALRAKKVPAELHIYPSGGHGWGFRREPYGRDTLGEPYRSVFFTELLSFLESVRG
ncbi:MAG: alpha/beta hydrolase [Bacteroidales bacterium]|nr:alpha/beta hydrolase [Bacteroidales bacterium]